MGSLEDVAWVRGGISGFPLVVPYSDLACPFSLFPTMPRHNYRRVAPLVKAFCAKHGLHYEVKPFLTALVDIIG